jgi:hypothetical protein
MGILDIPYNPSVLSDATDVANAGYIGSFSSNDPTQNVTIAQALTDVTNLKAKTDSPWKSKVIAWYGTSIPQYSNYAQNVANNIGAVLYKRAQGGSKVSINGGTMNTSYYINGNFHGTLSDWSETIAEKQFIIDNYGAIYPTLTDTTTVFPNASQMSANTVVFTSGPYGSIGSQDVIRNWSFEQNCINEFMNTGSTSYISPADLIIIDHGYNDGVTLSEYNKAVLLNTRDSTQSGYTAAVTASRDRLTFQAGINYVIDQIYKYNPKQRILIISHFDLYKANGAQNLIKTQQELAKYWQIPIVNVYERMGISDQIAIGSQPLWSQAPYNLYSAGQDTAHDMTQFNVFIPDRVHPHTDSTNHYADKRIEAIITNYINTLHL